MRLRVRVRRARTPGPRSARGAGRARLRWLLPVVVAVAMSPGTSVARPVQPRTTADVVAAPPRAHQSRAASADRGPAAPADASAPRIGFSLSATPAGRSGRAAVASGASTARIVITLGESGIPEVALRAYVRAEQTVAVSDPSCGLRWWLLAAIGRVESNHGRFGGAGLREDGYGTRPIRGIPLDASAGRGADPGHRRRRTGRRSGVRPCCWPHAVHPVDVAFGRGRRERGRAPRPRQPVRRGARRGDLPVLR